MDDPASLALIVVTAFIASMVASTAGFGGGIILLPLIVSAFGVRSAVPILAVVQLVASIGRATFNREELSRALVARFMLGAMPAAVLGAALFASVPAELIKRLLGVFLLLIVFQQRLRPTPVNPAGTRSIYLAGAIIGFLSGLLGVVGPLLGSYFLRLGLKKGAYVGSVALASVSMQVVKVITYGGYQLLDADTMSAGLAIGAVMIAGAYAGKRVLDWLPDSVFRFLVLAVLLVSGLEFLLAP